MSFFIRFFSQKKQIDIEKKNSRKVKIEEDDEPGQNSCKEVRLEGCVGCKRCESACPTDFLSVRVYLWHETTRSMGLAY